MHMLPSSDYVRQVHYGPSDWDGVLYDTVSGLEFPIAQFKPMIGFWTSTLDASGGSPWQTFAERALGRKRSRNRLFQFEVVGDPDILVLKNDGDIRALLARLDIELVTIQEAIETYMVDPVAGDVLMAKSHETSDGYAKVLNWISENHDAMHVPAHHSRAGFLRPWDVESTVWFRPGRFLRAVATKDLGRI